ncbi:hypothetical protein PSHT_05298 [Puccinia striiformis]|uniref:Uncharacterized protein n=1 Tax=Puccinia striiformis TaxID=27350 RepID=A0A2S4WAV9_9BASI|nr:hypothetical protein PSHT_05298 [Puccinia striiformis]
MFRNSYIKLSSLPVTGIYTDLSLTEPKGGRKARKISNEIHINQLTNKLNGLNGKLADGEIAYAMFWNDGRNRLINLIGTVSSLMLHFRCDRFQMVLKELIPLYIIRTVQDLHDISFCGNIDMEETWERYMVNERFSKKNYLLPKTLPEEENLRETLYKLTKGSSTRGGWSKYHKEDSALWRINKSIELMKDFKVTKGTVSVAVDFHTFAMAWHSSRVYDSFALALAISRSTQMEFENRVKNIDKTDKALWAMSENYVTLEAYQQEAKRMLDKPHRVSGFDYPLTVGKYSDVVKFSQVLDLSFIHDESYSWFWKCLASSTKEEGLQPFIEALQDLFTYFRKGRPFDNSFEYHQLLVEISTKIRQHLEMNPQKAFPTTLHNLGKETRSSQSTVVSGTASINLHSLHRKAKLVMNYVEEFSQDVKKKGFISRFSPGLRAQPADIRHLNFSPVSLICDHMSPIYVLYEEKVTRYDIRRELEYEKLPRVIQQDMLGIMGENYDTSSFGDFWKSLVAKTDKDSKEHVHFSMLPDVNHQFKNNPIIWKQVYLMAMHELSSLGSANTEKLIIALKKGQRILNMKKLIFTVMSARLQTLEKSLLPRQFGRLMKIFKLTKDISNQPLYSIWVDTYLKEISTLEHDLAMIFDDILSDASRSTLVKKMAVSFNEDELKKIFPILDQAKFKTDKMLKSKFWKIINLTNPQRVEVEIIILAEKLTSGRIVDFSKFKIGDLMFNEMSVG